MAEAIAQRRSGRRDQAIRPLQLPLALTCDQRDWQTANPEILWCWKRDQGPLQRSIFFGGRLVAERVPGPVSLHDWGFFYRHRARTDHIDQIMTSLDTEAVHDLIGHPKTSSERGCAMATLELRSRALDEPMRSVIDRLLQLRPRAAVPRGRFPRPRENAFDLSAAAPIVVYAGSGLSYETGLPTLAEIHRDFGVDDYERRTLTFGSEDPIPAALGSDPLQLLARFARFHVTAANARPSFSHRAIERLHRDGIVHCVLTDNVDNLFSKCNVPFTRTRTVFPQTYPYDFGARARTLLVIGVAADRRRVIAQARQRGLRIVVVNPHGMVSPRAQNLSYLRPSDVWYKTTAKRFFAVHAIWS